MDIEKMIEISIILLAGAFGYVIKGVITSIQNLEKFSERTDERLDNLKDLLKDVREETRSCNNYERGGKKKKSLNRLFF